MSSARYRRAGPGDVRTLADLHALCFDSPWDAAAFGRLLARPGASCLLAFEGGAEIPAAFVLFEHVADEAEILSLGVRPECRRQGLAAGLLAHRCGELARLGVKRVHLEVAEINRTALALYRTAGFAQTGRRPGYYRGERGVPPADGLIFSRGIGPSLRR